MNFKKYRLNHFQPTIVLSNPWVDLSIFTGQQRIANWNLLYNHVSIFHNIVTLSQIGTETCSCSVSCCLWNSFGSTQSFFICKNALVIWSTYRFEILTNLIKFILCLFLQHFSVYLGKTYTIVLFKMSHMKL